MGIVDRVRMALDGNLTMGNLLERLAKVHGDRQLVTESGEGGLRLTYREAADLVARQAGGIRKQISPGDRIIINTDNGYGLFLLCLAASRAGGVAVPVNPKMRPEEIDHVINDSGAQLVLRDSAEVDGADPVAAAPAAQSDTAALFYTSGTTGKPKGAELSHRALVGSANRMTLVPNGLLQGEVVCGLPVAHIAGFTSVIMWASVGVPSYLLTKFRPDTALDAIEQRRATIFVGVPAMYRMMLEAGAEDRDLRSVRLWASGADAMPDELLKKFKAMGATITLPLIHSSLGKAAFIDGYGMVELAGGVAMRFSPPVIDLPIGNSLVVPMRPFKLKVIDDEQNEVGFGQVGELVVKGPGVMKGYHGKDEATDEATTRDGWLRTGDLARKGPFGLVEFAGRKKDVIKHGGYSVFAVEVQETLEQHPAVAEAAVIGLPDERKGEVPVAAVRLSGEETVTEDDLIAWAKERMADYKVPQRIKFVDDLPRTGTDKVQKKELRPLFED